MESQTDEKPKDVEAAEEEDKSSERQRPPAVKDASNSCYPTFAVVSFWQGRVEIAFRCVLTLILPLGLVIATRVTINNLTSGSVNLTAFRPVFRWLLALTCIHMIYEGTILCIRFWKTLFLKRITNLLIMDIVASIILMVAYFATGPPVAKDVRFFGQIRCSEQQTLLISFRLCKIIDEVFMAGIAACVLLYLIIGFLIAKAVWNYLFLRHKWNRFEEENSKPMPCFRCCKL